MHLHYFNKQRILGELASLPSRQVMLSNPHALWIIILHIVCIIVGTSPRLSWLCIEWWVYSCRENVSDPDVAIEKVSAAVPLLIALGVTLNCEPSLCELDDILTCLYCVIALMLNFKNQEAQCHVLGAKNSRHSRWSLVLCLILSMFTCTTLGAAQPWSGFISCKHVDHDQKKAIQNYTSKLFTWWKMNRLLLTSTQTWIPMRPANTHNGPPEDKKIK